MQVTYADSSSIPELANLFDQYRIFYEQETDIKGAIAFLNSRFKNKDSVIFIASENSGIVGFAQLYPSFSSVGMERIWILNDLFVSSNSRRQSIAKKLMEAARKHAEETGALRVELATQVSNTLAQKLYASLGYSKNESFYHYSLPILKTA
jgi:ribosomal protein S18 acetylase RimI-like enzyme